MIEVGKLLLCGCCSLQLSHMHMGWLDGGKCFGPTMGMHIGGSREMGVTPTWASCLLGWTRDKRGTVRGRKLLGDSYIPNVWTTTATYTRNILSSNDVSHGGHPIIYGWCIRWEFKNNTTGPARWVCRSHSLFLDTTVCVCVSYWKGLPSFFPRLRKRHFPLFHYPCDRTLTAWDRWASALNH